MAKKKTTEVERAEKLRHLEEFIDALDRRVPHVERAGEIAIAREAEGLKKKAERRIAALKGKKENS